MEFDMTRHKVLNKVKQQYIDFINDFIYTNYNQTLVTREENKNTWKLNYGYTPHLKDELIFQTKVFLRIIKNYTPDFTARLVDFMSNFLSSYVEKSDTFQYNNDKAKKYVTNELNTYLDETGVMKQIVNATNALTGRPLKNAITINYPLFANNVRLTGCGRVRQEIVIKKKRIVISYSDWDDFDKNVNSRVLNALQTLRKQEREEKVKKAAEKKSKNKKQKLSPLAKTMREINRKKRELARPDDNVRK